MVLEPVRLASAAPPSTLSCPASLTTADSDSGVLSADLTALATDAACAAPCTAAAGRLPTDSELGWPSAKDAKIGSTGGTSCMPVNLLEHDVLFESGGPSAVTHT